MVGARGWDALCTATAALPEPARPLGKADSADPGHTSSTAACSRIMLGLCLALINSWLSCACLLFACLFQSPLSSGHLKLCGQLGPEGANYQTARVWEGANLNFYEPLPALKGFNKHVYNTDDDRSLQSIFWTFLCPLPRASKKHILFYCCTVQKAAKEHRP